MKHTFFILFILVSLINQSYARPKFPATYKGWQKYACKMSAPLVNQKESDITGIKEIYQMTLIEKRDVSRDVCRKRDKKCRATIQHGEILLCKSKVKSFLMLNEKLTKYYGANGDKVLEFINPYFGTTHAVLFDKTNTRILSEKEIKKGKWRKKLKVYGRIYLEGRTTNIKFVFARPLLYYFDERSEKYKSYSYIYRPREEGEK